MMKRTLPIAIALILVVLGAACGSDDENLADGPIPVEPDGGIGDGAGPPPFADDEVAEPAGDWHGRQLAETNCPGTEWQRIEASAFSFSLPVDFIDENVQGIDSEVGSFVADGFQVGFDYGWYSPPLDQEPAPTELRPVDYSGFLGSVVVAPAETSSSGQNLVGVYFPQVVADQGPQWNALSLWVHHDRPADEIIGRCIVGSVEWNAQPPSS